MTSVASDDPESDLGRGAVWRSHVEPPGVRPEIPTYLFHSIAVTLLCCLPLGLVAIYFAAQVNSKLASGDIHGAQEASARARTWCWVAFLSGFVVVIAWLLLILTAGVANAPMNP